jgi:hypothetical protein
MKSKLVLIGLMILSLLAISANAQTKGVQQVILQDDGSGDHLIFVISDGQYKLRAVRRTSPPAESARLL